jgi:hypothetical protein
MRFALSALLIAHGVAHLVGFVVPWKLLSTAEVPYRTTILGGMMFVVGWPEARIGIIVNAVLLATLLAMSDLAVR